MFREERCNEILRLVSEKGFVTVAALCEALDYSPATIRRDLIYMQQKNLIEKSYGGVSPVLPEKRHMQLYELRMHDFLPEKRKIAATASSLIRDGQVIFIDSSSTCFHMLDYVEHLPNITVITNSLDVGSELRKRNITGYCTGGAVNPLTPALDGTMTCAMLAELNIDLAFFSTTSISRAGMISDYNESYIAVFKQMMKSAEKVAYLTYAERIGTTSMFNVCHIREVDYIISERNIQDQFMDDTGNAVFLY